MGGQRVVMSLSVRIALPVSRRVCPHAMMQVNPQRDDQHCIAESRCCRCELSVLSLTRIAPIPCWYASLRTYDVHLLMLALTASTPLSYPPLSVSTIASHSQISSCSLQRVSITFPAIFPPSLVRMQPLEPRVSPCLPTTDTFQHNLDSGQPRVLATNCRSIDLWQFWWQSGPFG